MIEHIDFEKMNGLVPAIVQDVDDGTVLMIGFMNNEAVQRTLEERHVVFWSRTKDRLWKKGETSGNYLHVVSVEIDCDKDSLLIKARPEGPVCHTGAKSCFGQNASVKRESVLIQLAGIIRNRKENLPEGSYTAGLFNRGVAIIGQKVGEEAVELAIAAQYQDKQRSIEEAADLLYHILVLLEAKEIELSEVLQELGKRMMK
ncbi:MAG: bifunctional phosphoribosyl-AMP cyclohydrolase/phosphoribosyl-ATP diphosphatase HisIE [Ignavibacteria bacterium]|nr:bifunctional phosphoribosyl-AMP cyclohydrolase/phosphoribosyl-ATP diphosphatase HisIE [Ignavibacteria bacterium]